ncbi:MAG TPA: hypothetical protein VII06_41895 [Chloroflexota bacterium]|jgi:hypothetical protein
MAVESIVVAQIVRLFRERPGVVWEIIEPATPARPGDVPLRDPRGQAVAYARPSDAVSHPGRA